MLLRGPAGVGKTTLAQHLGQRALENGLAVRFGTLLAALADLLRQESLPATERRLKRHVRPDLLVLDELGYVAFKQWGSVFQDASCLSALIDRFAQHCSRQTLFDVRRELDGVGCRCGVVWWAAREVSRTCRSEAALRTHLGLVDVCVWPRVVDSHPGGRAQSVGARTIGGCNGGNAEGV